MPASLNHKIRNKSGDVIKSSSNLRGIREFVSGYLCPPITTLAVDELESGEGKLCILFSNGDNYETNFASFDVLLGFVRRWRNVYGAPLKFNGVDAGEVSYRCHSLIGY